DALRSALGDQLKSVVVFGSMASGEFHPERSDVNVLVVADVSFDGLRRMGPALQAWIGKRHTPPVLIGPNDLAGYARSFPIEFFDMLDHHRLLFGNNPLPGLRVDPRHLHAQCEHDLALLQLKLRQTIACSAGDTERI